MMPVVQEFLGQSSAVGHNTRSQSSMLRRLQAIHQGMGRVLARLQQR